MDVDNEKNKNNSGKSSETLSSLASVINISIPAHQAVSCQDFIEKLNYYNILKQTDTITTIKEYMIYIQSTT